MTDKDMNKLADLIIGKLKKLQQDLDDDYFQRMEDHGWEASATAPLNEVTFEETKNVLLEQLETNLELAIEEEDYEEAAKLREKIKDLKGKE